MCLESHLLHYDPATNGSASGSVRFTSDIVGIILSILHIPLVGRPLDVTDSAFGLATTAYSSGDNDRGADVGLLAPRDTIGFDLATDTVTMSFVVPNDPTPLNNEVMDQVRVITLCSGPDPEIPEAGTVALLSITALALGGGFAALQRRRATA